MLSKILNVWSSTEEYCIYNFNWKKKPSKDFEWLVQLDLLYLHQQQLSQTRTKGFYITKHKTFKWFIYTVIEVFPDIGVLHAESLTRLSC